jgi:hypothetical protein
LCNKRLVNAQNDLTNRKPNKTPSFPNPWHKKNTVDARGSGMDAAFIIIFSENDGAEV